MVVLALPVVVELIRSMGTPRLMACLATLTCSPCIIPLPFGAVWGARALVWPDGDCKPLCIKLTGKGSEVIDYGRTAVC
jgi:hypothetical protein